MNMNVTFNLVGGGELNIPARSISGFYKDAWEFNTPKDGIIDRFQVAMYPSGSGEQELHQDPYLFQKFFISIYLSKKNIDYKSGGIYLIDKVMPFLWEFHLKLDH